MSFISEMRDLIREQDNNHEVGSALWTRLPSHQEALRDMENEGLNKDYVHEQLPSTAAIMEEACEVIAYLLGHTIFSCLHEQHKEILESNRVK